MLGIAIGLLTGMVNTTPNLVGATWYGWPQPWLFVVVYPGSPAMFSSSNLSADILFWLVISVIVLVCYNRLVHGRARKPARTTRKPRRRA